MCFDANNGETFSTCVAAGSEESHVEIFRGILSLGIAISFSESGSTRLFSYFNMFVRFRMSTTDRATDLGHIFALGKFVPFRVEPQVLHEIKINPWQNSSSDK